MHDEQALRRFEQQARAAGSLNHADVLRNSLRCA
jgi:hypothetical protein